MAEPWWRSSKLDGVRLEHGGVQMVWPLMAKPCGNLVVLVELHGGWEVEVSFSWFGGFWK